MSQVLIRSVWAYNLDEEFSLIHTLLQQYRFAAIDTEFPGFIYHSRRPHLLSAEEFYVLLKSNVDHLHLIQVGLTLFDANGNLPDLGTHGAVYYAWEFNLRDFDIYSHCFAPESINFLSSNGFDFDHLRTYGIDSSLFAQRLVASHLVGSDSNIEWVTFSGAYDFGYLIKILMGSPLPERREDFMRLLTSFFGERLFDIKTIMRYCDGLYGGLEQVARTLNVVSTVGRPRRAGSNSVLASRTFLEMRNRFFIDRDMTMHAGAPHGLNFTR
ncbi:probable CCR4-associated factor 1 homolog 11 [Elaeis guineensis]|uniref:poly(A)-specific ribonuclease n=1 Tax=Elaeis guineensis var. tenera TaxID=51953 RepID=A0A6I9RAJ0_ELAGV|nr:probable CCR4-associated factor 1 homolog 11 [Elaeis guineensis]